MIDYELAQELKDAGFPLQECTLKGCYYSGGSLDEDGKNYHYPTLSELIEACGDEFESLYKLEGGTRSVKGNDVIGGYECMPRKESCGWSWGSTPEEAVAKLWLAINKHD